MQTLIRFAMPSLFVGIVAGTLGFVFPIAVPFAGFVIGFILLADSLRVFHPEHFWQIALQVLGILIICGVATNLTHSGLCSAPLQELVPVRAGNCQPNSVGATTFAASFFVGMATIGMLVMMLWGTWTETRNYGRRLVDTLKKVNAGESHPVCPKCGKGIVQVSYTHVGEEEYGTWLECSVCDMEEEAYGRGRPPGFRQDLINPKFQRLDEATWKRVRSTIK